VLAAGLVARRNGADEAAVLVAFDIAVAVAAAGLTANLLLGGWARGVITGLVVDLGRLERAAPLADEIGRAVGDRSLTIAYRGGEGYVDEAGRPVELPAPGDRQRTATLIFEAGEPVAALVHDPSALADPELERAAAAAARLALGNVRLRREVAARVEELEASAQRLVLAGDAEHRRLARAVEEQAERRLADAARRLADVEPQLAAEAAEARAEVRHFAAGLRPRRLAADGLAAALEDLTRPAVIPVEVRAPQRRFADVVEVTAFFVCSEALANVAKHARAASVRVEIAERGGRLVAEVADDGIGGADGTHGSGLRGLTDRVEALGGTLDVVSAPGAGTIVRAEMPAGAP
jgi:signal transduction histidine kinase